MDLSLGLYFIFLRAVYFFTAPFFDTYFQLRWNIILIEIKGEKI